MLTRTYDRARLLALLVPLALLALLALSALTPPAHAAAGCFEKGPTRVGPNSHGRVGKVATQFCHVYTSGEVVLGGPRVGVLEAGRSWFVCQRNFPDFPNPKVGGARNTYWLWTKADHSIDSKKGGWGWFPATKISGGVNNNLIPGLRICPANF
jgi:hypothetical protein